MPSVALWLADEQTTVGAGERLAVCLQPGVVVYLCGQLGAGKTTLTRGILRQLGHTGAVKSPTYTLVEPYEQLAIPVFHFDLYRLGDPEELAYMGVRDYFHPNSLCLVEWPERGQGFLPEADIRLELQPQTSTTGAVGRLLTITTVTLRGAELLGATGRELLGDLWADLTLSLPSD